MTMDNTFLALAEKWRKNFLDKGGQKSIGHTLSELRFGVKHAVIMENEILPLELSIYVVGESPSLHRLHCCIKFEWGIKCPFSVVAVESTPSSPLLKVLPTASEQLIGLGAL